MGFKTKTGTCECCGKENIKTYYNHKLWKCNQCCKQYWEENKEHNSKTKNPITDIGNGISIMWVYTREGWSNGAVMFDSEFAEKISKYKWSLDSKGYAVSGGNKENNYKKIWLHRFVLGAENNVIVDHITGELIDCRLSNLRVCTLQQNNYNRGLRKDNTSGVIGVYYWSPEGKWRAEISCNGKNHTLGRFETKEEAIKARLEAEEKYYGEFSPSKSRKLIK